MIDADRATVGRTIERIFATGSTKRDSYPLAGSHPRRTAKTAIKMMPSQYEGIAIPAAATADIERSRNRRGRRTAMIAEGMATASENAVTRVVSSSVSGSLRAISLVVDSPLKYETPKSP